MNRARFAVAVAIGAVGCTMLDHLHATLGVLWYRKPDFWSQSWWVPLLFGAWTAMAMLIAEPARRMLRGAPLSPPSQKRLLLDVALFVGAYASTAFFHAQPTLLAVALTVAWLIRVAFEPRWVAAVCVLSAVGGPLFEAQWSSLGFFYYHHPDWIGVARWLPGLYLHVGMLAVTGAAAVRAGAPAAPTPRREPQSARAPSGT